MIKSAFLSGVLLIGSLNFASAAGGGAAGGAAGTAGGAHAGGAHAGSSFGKPAVGNNPFPGVTARPGCVGGITGASSTGAPSPMALPSQLSPSPTNGSAVKGQLQSTPDVARLTQQDQRLLGDIKQANERLGQVGNPSGTPNSGQQPGSVVGSAGDLQRQGSGASRPLSPPQTNSSAVKESTDRGLAQGKLDVYRMSEQDQRLVREIIRETEKLGTVGNPNARVGRPQAQQGLQTGPGSDLRRDTNGPHLPVNTMGAASGSAC